ncbi:hypothetical protein ATANTOWER_011564 [Ataeniobius toweri]|uniref:Uncharacterized protein n=1 Tax=Ataeniobius toweri TaxID=208326 RepID=A0ABU7A5P4_9TELE|nr:hypothetical protein [Ataeniobius toweri]
MFRESAVLSGPGQLTRRGEAKRLLGRRTSPNRPRTYAIKGYLDKPIRYFSFTPTSGLCYFRLNNLLRPAMNRGIGWDTEDAPEPSFKSGDKKDVFVGRI